MSGSPSIGPVKRFGRFTLVKKLATGGMAEIWLARQTGLAGFNRFVVIKKILSHLAEEETFVKMFLDEARMSSQLSHPNIVQVYDLGQADEAYFIAMEYIAGENLAAIAWRGVKRKNPLSPIFAARILADACKALHYAHTLRSPEGTPLEIVHRDISPQNILVTYEGEVKVVDFGIAKAATKSQHTKTGMLKGKFSYMSPEQCLGHPVDARSDVFALGIVLYELCTGKRLFKHESELMILEMITKRRPTPPSEVEPSIAPELEEIIMRALEKDVTARYGSAREMQLALDNYLRQEKTSSSSSEVSAYLRLLFLDKMDEKRKLCELASKDELVDSLLEQESRSAEFSGPDPSRRRVVYGRPSDIRVSGVSPGHPTASHPGMMPMATPTAHPLAHPMATPAHPGATPLGYPMPGYPPLYAGSHPGMYAPSASHPGAYEQGSNWGPRVVIAVATLVILLALLYLGWELTREAPLTTTAAPVQLGFLQLDSIPSGATILVDGKPVKLDSGEDAKTPIEQLAQLEFGRTYQVQLAKPGFKPHVETLVMGAAINGRRIKPTLEAYPGRIIAELRGDPAAVNVFVNGQVRGFGREVAITLPPGPARITAEAEGWKCAASPDSVTIGAQQTERATITCEKPSRATPVRPPKTPDGAGKRPAPPPATGCNINPDAPPGMFTITTIPDAEIWYGETKLGETPINKVRLPSGCVELVAIHRGPPTVQKTLHVTIEPNRETKKKDLRLTPF